MLRRCQDPNDKGYANYGGRGIKVCDRWQDFAKFFADMGKKPQGMSIERIDNNKGYEPGNCRWATPTEQGRNRRTNVLFTFQGKTLCLKEWCIRLGHPPSRIYKRIEIGWAIEKALELA